MDESPGSLPCVAVAELHKVDFHGDNGGQLIGVRNLCSKRIFFPSEINLAHRTQRTCSHGTVFLRWMKRTAQLDSVLSLILTRRQIENRFRSRFHLGLRGSNAAEVIFLIESRTKLWYHLLANNVKTRSNRRHVFYVENPWGKKTRAQIGDLHYDERVATQRIQWALSLFRAAYKMSIYGGLNWLQSNTETNPLNT
jgi:hypothetical protein